jgi:hypothetical protein
MAKSKFKRREYGARGAEAGLALFINFGANQYLRPVALFYSLAAALCPPVLAPALKYLEQLVVAS